MLFHSSASSLSRRLRPNSAYYSSEQPCFTLHCKKIKTNRGHQCTPHVHAANLLAHTPLDPAQSIFIAFLALLCLVCRFETLCRSSFHQGRSRVCPESFQILDVFQFRPWHSASTQKRSSYISSAAPRCHRFCFLFSLSKERIQFHRDRKKNV